jgi:outer membrane receptor protein involved in Fe transport
VWSERTVVNVAGFRRLYESRLLGSEFDTPITAIQDRSHSRLGFIASLTHATRGHTFKFGVESSRVRPDEFFSFAVTDPEEAEESDISGPALQFGVDNPFVFREEATGRQVSAYAQDSFSPIENLTINAGMRFDRFSLKVSDSQFSPRVGAVYYIPKTATAVRASFNRLFMPPQIENLLLADSEQARILSPFASESGGGELIRAERTSAYEAGFAQGVLGHFRLDAAYWRRDFRNVSDPNVFFSTTVIFPNSVAEGFARGIDIRLDFARRRGWTAYASYANQRILQTGPINGGLFLTDEFIDLGPGVKFIPDHDQRNVFAFGVMYDYHKFWISFTGRHESGSPLEVDEMDLEELREQPGADLVDFDRARIKPYTVFNLAAEIELFKEERVTAGLQLEAQNILNKRFAYNFGNPFSGTHFGHPRLIGARLRLAFN